MKLSPETKLTELAQQIECNGSVYNRTQLRALPTGGMAFDPTAPVVTTRTLNVQLGRSKGYATFDGDVLRLDVKGARSYSTILTDNGFVSSAGMGWTGGKLMHTLADWHIEEAASHAASVQGC